MASGTENYRKAAFFNKPEEDSSWSNVLSKIKGQRWLGYRQVYRMDNNRVLVTVLELYPVHGRRWNLFYNNGVPGIVLPRHNLRTYATLNTHTLAHCCVLKLIVNAPPLIVVFFRSIISPRVVYL